MFGLFRRTRRQSSPRRPVRPALESLETRDCPAAPTLSQLSAVPMAGASAYLSGQVIDEIPPFSTLSFSGAWSGTATVMGNGWFYKLASGATLGTVNVTVTDIEGLTGTGSIVISVPPPTLTGFAYTQVYRNTVNLTGTVNSPDSFNTELVVWAPVSNSALPGPGGAVSKNFYSPLATTTSLSFLDSWGRQVWGSATIPNEAPEITNFTISYDAVGAVTLSGSVEDEFAEGLTVEFAGIPSLSNWPSTQVGSQDNFAYTFYPSAGESGTITAKLIDWFLEDSNVASQYFAGL